MAPRSIELLNAAADALLDGTDPFHDRWLVDHNVTFDECMTLANQLAAGATILAWALENPKQALGAVNGAHMAAVSEALHKALDRWQP